MVRKIHKTNIFYASLVALLLASSSQALPVSAVNVDLQANITEVLSVSVTTPDSWASGNVDINNGSDLLRNKIILNVSSNNSAGFTASMASKDTTNLVNQGEGKSSIIIPTLASSTTAASFPVNYWGYSIDDTDAGSSSANYSALKTEAITIANSSSPASIAQNIFFGARADATKDSGTYANTVVISVVSGVDTAPDSPIITPDPNDPVTPSNPTETPSNNSTNSGSNIAYLDDTSKEETTEEPSSDINKGNITNSYAEPQGVTTSNINSDSSLATGLAVTAGVAATSGIIFFIVAKRKKDEEEEEDI